MRFSVKRGLPFLAFCLAMNLFFAPLTHAAGVLIPNDPAYPDQWYLHQINAPEAWAVTTGSAKVTVAVIDAGVDFEHPEFAGLHVVDGWNFVTNTSDTRPLVGKNPDDTAMSHGTIVTSLLAARGNDGIGMAGVAWNISVMPLVVLDMNGSGTEGNIAKAVEYAIAHHVDIISISLVGYEQDDGLEQAIKDAADAGILVVAAAGNTDGWKNGEDLDVVEVRNAFSAIDKRSIPGSYADTDRDGLDDRLEWLFKTDPYNPDTDADGNVDGREIASAFSPTSTATSTLQKRLRVVLSTQRMERHLGGVLLDRHAISSGLPKTPTPVGEFKILNKNRRAWSKSAKLWMPWWMGISTRGYGLHELPEWPGGLKEGAAHLGRMASHGCVRMGEGVAKMVYDWTPIGTPVSIVKK
jgi:lipoprotein-anchoring transpeptidase ErfK/SrfK